MLFRSKGKLESAPKDPKDPKQNTGSTARAVALAALDPMLDSRVGLLVNVLKCSYIVRRSARQPGKSLLLAVYDCETDTGISVDVTQFVCVEYEGGARWHAEQWARRRRYTNCSAFPRDAHQARVECYALPVPRKLQVRRRDGHMDVMREIF